MIYILKWLVATSIAILLMIGPACSGRTGKAKVPVQSNLSELQKADQGRLINFRSPDENAGFRLNDQVKIVLEPAGSTLPDSVILFFDGRKLAVLKNSPWEILVPQAMTSATGRKSIKATAYSKGRTATILTRFIIIYSDTPPVRYGYSVLHTYPHDRDAFTQGLFYNNGVFYEGTGQQTGSTLREVEIATGKVLRILNLRADLFGEGITLFKDRIYQVTWQSKVGFVYERATFRQINKIYYQTEGWGLTTMNDRIVMSDGTNVLYFFDPETFTVVSRLEVYDNEKKIDSLNELEYINGEIWANIWMTDLIARIDPASGKVNGIVDLRGILKDPSTDTGVNVLNGIAWDSEGKRIFVTGKNWPKLFEIKVIR